MSMLSGFKSLGDGRWVGFFSNIFYDRDIKPDAPRGERFTYDALKEASEWMNGGNLPVLEIFHLDGVKVGTADNTFVVGPFIIAEGVWNDDELGQKARAFFDKTDKNWRMSHGFGYTTNDRVNGEYIKFRPHELTILPEEWAANTITFFKGEDMAGLKDDIANMLVEVFGLKPDEAKAKVDEELQKRGKALADGELTGTKEADAAAATTTETAAETPPTQTAETPADNTTADPAQEDALALALVDALTELSEERALRAQLADEVKALKADMASVNTAQKAKEDALESRLKALEEADKERQTLLPKAVRAALSKRVADDKDSTVENDKAVADIDGREAGLKGKANAKSDPVGFMMNQAGIG